MILQSWLQKWRKRRHEEWVIKRAGWMGYCPCCDEIVNERAPVENRMWHWVYRCSHGTSSRWIVGICPLPIFDGLAGEPSLLGDIDTVSPVIEKQA